MCRAASRGAARRVPGARAPFVPGTRCAASSPHGCARPTHPQCRLAAMPRARGGRSSSRAITTTADVARTHLLRDGRDGCRSLAAPAAFPRPRPAVPRGASSPRSRTARCRVRARSSCAGVRRADAGLAVLQPPHRRGSLGSTRTCHGSRRSGARHRCPHPGPHAAQRRSPRASPRAPHDRGARPPESRRAAAEPGVHVGCARGGTPRHARPRRRGRCERSDADVPRRSARSRHGE